MKKDCWTCEHRLSKRTTDDNIRNYCKLTVETRSNTGHKRIKAKGKCILNIQNMAQNKVSDEVITVLSDVHYCHISEFNISSIDDNKLIGFVKIHSRDPEMNKKIVSAIKRVLKSA